VSNTSMPADTTSWRLIACPGRLYYHNIHRHILSSTYNLCTRNCQHFVNQTLTWFGFPEYTQWTQSGKVGLGLGLSALVLGATALWQQSKTPSQQEAIEPSKSMYQEQKNTAFSNNDNPKQIHGVNNSNNRGRKTDGKTVECNRSWSCTVCTFHNSNHSARSCELCGARRLLTSPSQQATGTSHASTIRR
jgi:hypothetical protein